MLSYLGAFRDELLIAALTLLLRVPIALICSPRERSAASSGASAGRGPHRCLFSRFASALHLSLQLGFSYLPLTDSALSALEAWAAFLLFKRGTGNRGPDRVNINDEQNVANETSEAHKVFTLCLSQVLPLLGEFLRTQDLLDDGIKIFFF